MQENMLISPMKNMDSYVQILKNIDQQNTPIAVQGLNEGSIGHFIYALNQHKNRQILVVTYDELRARKIFEDIKNFKQDGVEFFYGKEVFLYDVEAFSHERIYDRLRVLSNINEEKNIIVVTYIEALLNKILSKELFSKYTTELRCGEIISLDELISNFAFQGYERVFQVESKGQFSVRGGIVDFFPPNVVHPYRVEFFDDEVDSIRSFDIRSQRSIEKLEKAVIPPVEEILILEEYKMNIIKGIEKDLEKISEKKVLNSREKSNVENKFSKYIEMIKENLSLVNTDMIVPYIPEEYLSTIVDYFDEDSIVLLDEPDRIKEKIDEIDESFLENFTDIFQRGELLTSHSNIYFDYSSILNCIKKKICITTTSLLKNNPNYVSQDIVTFTTKSMQPFHNKMDFLQKN